MNDVINEFYAFLAVDEEDGNEGVVARTTPNNMIMPLVASNKERVKSLLPIAQEIADASNVEVRLVKFSVRESVKTISPSSAHKDTTIKHKKTKRSSKHG